MRRSWQWSTFQNDAASPAKVDSDSTWEGAPLHVKEASSPEALLTKARHLLVCVNKKGRSFVAKANASHTHGKIHVTGTRIHVLECRSSWFPLDWRTHLQHRVKTDRSQRLTEAGSGQDHRHSTSSCLSSPQSKWSTCVLLSETNIGHDNPQGTTASGTQAVSGITTLPGIQASGTTAASGMTTLEAFKPSGTKPGLCCMSGTAIRKLPKRLQAEETGASRPLKLSSGPQKEVLQEGVEHQESSIFSSPVAQGQSQRFFATALLTFSSRFSRADRSTNTHSTGVLSEPNLNTSQRNEDRFACAKRKERCREAGTQGNLYSAARASTDLPSPQPLES
ncbi:hypothetical protein KCU99_g103, partial [Aureobasidium melanogenum]